MNIVDGVLTAIKTLVGTTLAVRIMLLVIRSILKLIMFITTIFMYINFVILIAQRVLQLETINVALVMAPIINGHKEAFVKVIAQPATILHQADIMVNTSYQHQQEPVELVTQTANFVSATVTHATCVETWPF